MRWPSASSSASGRRRRCDQSRSAAACSSAGASARRQRALDQLGPGAERARSARASHALRARCSRWRCTASPTRSANSSSTATTVSRCAGTASSCARCTAASRVRPLLVGVLLAREHVAGAAHGQHAARRSSGRPRSRARMREMCTSMRAVEGLERMALQRIHDLVARQHAAGALRQHDQQVELVAGQVAAPCRRGGPRARRGRSRGGRSAARRRPPAAGAARRSSAFTRASSSRGSNGLGR